MKIKTINYIKAFTLAEMVAVFYIIAVLTVVMISVLGGKTDKNKGLFKKALFYYQKNPCRTRK